MFLYLDKVLIVCSPVNIITVVRSGRLRQAEQACEVLFEDTVVVFEAM